MSNTKVKIHEFYLEQCLKLRKRRFEAVKLLTGKEKAIEEKVKVAENIEKEFNEKLLQVDLQSVDQVAETAMNMIMSTGEQLDQILDPFRREIKKVEEEADVLYEKIRTKYPQLEYDEIKQQIIDYINQHENK